MTAIQRAIESCQIEAHMRLQDRLEAREKLRDSEKMFSQNICERGVDDNGFARIRFQN